MSEGHSIDFSSLDGEQINKMVNAIEIISSYNLERKQLNESIKETLEDLAHSMNADKDSAKYIKKFARKAGTIHANNTIDDVNWENSVVEMLLDKATRSAITPTADE